MSVCVINCLLLVSMTTQLQLRTNAILSKSDAPGGITVAYTAYLAL
jgi:hypothetical protein